METQRVDPQGWDLEVWEITLQKTSLSLVPQLECSDWLRSPEETSQPLDGFLVQPCRVEWNPSVSETHTTDARTHTHTKQKQRKHRNKKTVTDAHTRMYTKRKHQHTEILEQRHMLTDGFAVIYTVVSHSKYWSQRVLWSQQWEQLSEPHLGLSVDIGPIVNQLCDHMLLPCQGCDVQGCVPFLLTQIHKNISTQT